MRRELTDDRADLLVREILDGDREAYEEIVVGYQYHVRAALAGFCRSDEEVEEFCHMAFVRAFVKLEEYRPGRGGFLAWLLTLARNQLRNELRRRRAEGRRALRYLECAAAAEPPYEGIEAARSALDLCLGSLEGAESRLVQGRYHEGLTSRQIAQTVGKSAEAVRRALQRLRERLRLCVERRLGRGGEPAS
jgi:RNA polymerase sigma-70 factor (ECF subfamily)